jgi:hypothetical protein
LHGSGAWGKQLFNYFLSRAVTLSTWAQQCDEYFKMKMSKLMQKILTRKLLIDKSTLFTNFKKQEFIEFCKELEVEGYSKLGKEELVEIVCSKIRFICNNFNDIMSQEPSFLQVKQKAANALSNLQLLYTELKINKNVFEELEKGKQKQFLGNVVVWLG